MKVSFWAFGLLTFLVLSCLFAATDGKPSGLANQEETPPSNSSEMTPEEQQRRIQRRKYLAYLLKKVKAAKKPNSNATTNEEERIRRKSSFKDKLAFLKKKTILKRNGTGIIRKPNVAALKKLMNKFGPNIDKNVTKNNITKDPDESRPRLNLPKILNAVKRKITKMNNGTRPANETGEDREKFKNLVMKLRETVLRNNGTLPRTANETEEVREKFKNLVMKLRETVRRKKNGTEKWGGQTTKEKRKESESWKWFKKEGEQDPLTKEENGDQENA